MDTTEYNSRIATFNIKYPTGGTRGVRFPDKDRKEAIVLLNYGCSAGLSSKNSASALRLNDSSIRRWEHGLKGNAGVTTKTSKRKAKRSKPVRSYTAVAPEPSPKQELTAHFPNGLKVSGLTLDQLRELTRA